MEDPSFIAHTQYLQDLQHSATSDRRTPLRKGARVAARIAGLAIALGAFFGATPATPNWWL